MRKERYKPYKCGFAMILRNLIEKNKFVLYVVTDDKFLPSDAGRKSISTIKDMVKKCADGGAKIFQYRAKKLDIYLQFKQAEAVKEECERNKLVFAINENLEVARALQADILHTGQEDLHPKIINEKLPNIKIGYSTHNREQVIKSIEISDILDYISFGPVFGTKTKENPYPSTGCIELTWAIKTSTIPVVAIGGINDKNIEEVLLAGARAVAMISYIFEDPSRIQERCNIILKKAGRFINRS